MELEDELAALLLLNWRPAAESRVVVCALPQIVGCYQLRAPDPGSCYLEPKLPTPAPLPTWGYKFSRRVHLSHVRAPFAFRHCPAPSRLASQDFDGRMWVQCHLVLAWSCLSHVLRVCHITWPASLSSSLSIVQQVHYVIRTLSSGHEPNSIQYTSNESEERNFRNLLNQLLSRIK